MTKKTKKNSCGCGCGCGDKFADPEEKVEHLKEAIKELGYKIEETEEGIRISE